MAGHVRYRLVKRFKATLSPEELERFVMLPAHEQLEVARRGLIQLLDAYGPRPRAERLPQQHGPDP